jgi:hypothetical protein
MWFSEQRSKAISTLSIYSKLGWWILECLFYIKRSMAVVLEIKDFAYHCCLSLLLFSTDIDMRQLPGPDIRDNGVVFSERFSVAEGCV